MILLTDSFPVESKLSIIFKVCTGLYSQIPFFVCLFFIFLIQMIQHLSSAVYEECVKRTCLSCPPLSEKWWNICDSSSNSITVLVLWLCWVSVVSNLPGQVCFASFLCADNSGGGIASCLLITVEKEAWTLWSLTGLLCIFNSRDIWLASCALITVEKEALPSVYNW